MTNNVAGLCPVSIGGIPKLIDHPVPYDTKQTARYYIPVKLYSSVVDQLDPTDPGFDDLLLHRLREYVGMVLAVEAGEG